MPRVSSQLQYDRHRFLERAWTQFPLLYALLSPRAQGDLHRYYAPTQPFDEQLLQEHMQRVTAEQPTLPNRAGKAFSKLYTVFRSCYEQADGDDAAFFNLIKKSLPGESAPRVNGQGKPRAVKIAGVVRPKLDAERIALMLVQSGDSQRSASVSGKMGVPAKHARNDTDTSMRGL